MVTDTDNPVVVNIKTSLPESVPVEWLKRGWNDLVATRFRAVFYGAVFALMGLLTVIVYQNKWQLTMGLVSGYFLMGPFICTGIYGLSQQLDKGQTISLRRSLTCWRANTGSIAFFAVILTFLMVVWARVSVILFALSHSHSFDSLGSVFGQLFTFQHPQFVLLWSSVGFVFASLAFAIGMISVPLMLDRNIDTVTAMFSSVKALGSYPKPLYYWAILVVVIIGCSMLMGFWPLLITAPVIGHATWHVYKDLVD